MAEEQRGRQISSWSELVMRTMELGIGAAILTADTAQHVVNDLVNRGHLAREESASMVDRLLEEGREQRAMLTEAIERSMKRALDQMDLARGSEVEALRKRVMELEMQMAHLTSQAAQSITEEEEPFIDPNE